MGVVPATVVELELEEVGVVVSRQEVGGAGCW